MKEISENKTKSKKNLIVLVGLFLSLIGAIFAIYLGIDGKIDAAWWEHYYFDMLIFFGVLPLIGVIIGFFYGKAGIALTLFVGFVSFVNAPMLISGFGILSFLVFLTLIGGIISLIGWLIEKKT
ncbi:MAG: hypothetical protein ACTSYF_01480 [Promethearchaeota archaeon]